MNKESVCGDSEILKKTDELKKRVETLRQLGQDWKENMTVLDNAAGGNKATLQSIRRLCKKNSQGSLVKTGLTLIAFPLPIVVDDVLGCSLLAAGLIQRRIKNSALYLEDLKDAFPNIIREMQKIRQEIV
jgi:hypothetical protein